MVRISRWPISYWTQNIMDTTLPLLIESRNFGMQIVVRYSGGSGTVRYSGASWLSGSVRDVQARDRGFDPRLR